MTNNENSNKSIHEAMNEVSKFYQILAEGQRGHHILFSPEMIRMTFEKDSNELSQLFHDNLEEINRVINQSLFFQSLDEKKNLIESLPLDVQRALVYGYFQLLEGQRTEKPILN